MNSLLPQMLYLYLLVSDPSDHTIPTDEPYPSVALNTRQLLLPLVLNQL